MTDAAKRQENIRHGIDVLDHNPASGYRARGANHYRSKLTPNQVRAILHSDRSSPSQVGKRFGVSGTNITYIWRGQTWKHIQ